MKIKEVKEILEEYNPEDQILIQFWVKDHIEESIGEITPNEWARMVELFDKYPPDNDSFMFVDLHSRAKSGGDR